MGRKTPGLNTSSMSDISFLLLAFFLLVSNINTDQGIARRLPPPLPPNQEKPPDIKERNIFVVKINSKERNPRAILNTIKKNLPNKYEPNDAKLQVKVVPINPDGKEEWSKTNTIEHPNAVLESETKESTLELFRNLITLDIPYIYDTSISDFSKITVNNIDSLKNFKRLFKKEILNIDFTKEKEKADFEYTMNSAVNQLGVKYKQENSKLRKNIIIGSIATVATSLLVFSDINQLTSCLAGLTEGAGLIHFMKQLFDFRVEKIALKDNDYYFLWLIKKASK